MPVPSPTPIFRITPRNLTPAGTHQILPYRRERLNTHHERQAGAGHMARDMVLGVQGWEASAESAGYGARGEGMTPGAQVGWAAWNERNEDAQNEVMMV